MSAPGPSDVVLAVLLAGACWTDLRHGKIRNVLTFPVMGFGVLAAPLFAAHWYDGALGLLAALGVGVALWRLGGAYHPGDVKLVMAAGALVGPETILRGILLGLLLALPAGLLVLLLRGRLGALVRFWTRGERSTPTRMAFAPVIAAGVVLARLQPWPDLWEGP